MNDCVHNDGSAVIIVEGDSSNMNQNHGKPNHGIGANHGSDAMKTPYITPQSYYIGIENYNAYFQSAAQQKWESYLSVINSNIRIVTNLFPNNKSSQVILISLLAAIYSKQPPPFSYIIISIGIQDTSLCGTQTLKKCHIQKW